MSKPIPAYKQSIEMRRDDINATPLESYVDPVFGFVRQDSPRSKTFTGSWSNGDPRKLYRAVDGRLFGTSNEGKRYEALLAKQEE